MAKFVLSYRTQDIVGRFCRELSLGKDVRKDSLELLVKGHELLESAQKRNAVVAGSVYGSAILNNMPRSIAAVGRVAEVAGSTVLARYYDFVDLGLMDAPMPNFYVGIYCDVLKVPGKVQRDAKRIVKENLQDLRAPHKWAPGIAAGAVYAAAQSHKVKLTQRGIAGVAGVNYATVSHWYSKLK